MGGEHYYTEWNSVRAECKTRYVMIRDGFRIASPSSFDGMIGEGKMLKHFRE